VFSTGFSNGSFFTNQLGCRRGDRLRAIVSHSGGGPFDDDSAYDAAGHIKCAGRPPAALIVHGDSDWIVGVDKGDESARHWTWANGCGANTSATSPAPCVAWSGCKAPVEYCRIPAIGHWLWSEGTKKTWSFFASF
jgi:polyhydroxybutyrate depolymerase